MRNQPCHWFGWSWWRGRRHYNHRRRRGRRCHHNGLRGRKRRSRNFHGHDHGGRRINLILNEGSCFLAQTDKPSPRLSRVLVVMIHGITKGPRRYQKQPKCKFPKSSAAFLDPVTLKICCLGRHDFNLSQWYSPRWGDRGQVGRHELLTARGAIDLMPGPLIFHFQGRMAKRAVNFHSSLVFGVNCRQPSVRDDAG